MQFEPSILIIGDDEYIRKTLAFIFRQAGYIVSTTILANGVSRYLESYIYDLIIIDINLPQSNGGAMASEIHRLHPDLPIIILSDKLMSDTLSAEKGDLFINYLVKPVDPARILDSVVELLSKSKPFLNTELHG